MDAKIPVLVHKLAECVYLCNNCFSACVEEDGMEMMKECIRLDKECAQICAATLVEVYPGSRFKREILTLCANACRACGQECAKFEQAHCQDCAKACQACAEACETFIER